MKLKKQKIQKVDAALVRSHTTLTATINEIKPPSNFLFDLLFSRRENLTTEKAEIGIWRGSRKCAPFVKKNGEALLVQGRGNDFQTIDTPHCRIKMAIQPGDVVFVRQPGSEIFSATDQAAGIAQYYSIQQQALVDQIAESEELLASQALQMLITYTPAETEDVFQVTFPRSTSHNTVAAVDWDEADKALVQIEEDFIEAKRLVSEDAGLSVTHCIMGSLAAKHFRQTMKANGLLDILNLTAGQMSLNNPWTNSGALPLGTMFGVQCWEYARTTTDHAGNTKNLIRAKYAEFIAVTEGAQFVCYYGAIADAKTLGNRLHVGPRFSKAWLNEDPSEEYILAASRPLPCPRRADATVSMKVVSGPNPANG